MEKKIDLTLKEITAKTLKKLKSSDIVMPSDYTDLFKEELDSIGLTFTDLDVLLSEESNRHLEKNESIIKETERLLSNTGKIISESNIAFKNNDQASLAKAQKEIENLMLMVNKISKEVFNDELTGVYNRKWFLREYLRDEKYPSTDGVIAFIDMNKLKIINDTYGHKVGDKSIVYFVTFIKENLEHSEIIRFAGDEFIVIFENGTRAETEMKLREVNEKLEKVKLRTFLNKEEVFLRLSFSFGTSTYKKDEDIIESIDKADHTMYLMKKKRDNKK